MSKSELHYRSPNLVNILVNTLWPIIERVFRFEVSGAEHIPKDGPFMLIANHNSGALIESHSLLAISLISGRRVYGLNHPSIFKIPLLGTYFRKIGAITASKEMAEQTLKMGEGLLIFPGGNRQALRPLSQINQKSFPWSTGWAKIAADKNIPVIPVKFEGTHKINPIFFSSKLISKVLILPWVLGIKWFPISLAQILSAILVLAVSHRLNISISISLTLTYLSFIFSCLLPVLPAKSKVRIYPPQSSERSEELSQQMNTLMNKQDTASGRRISYPLNGIEKFMYFHETDSVSYNSHLVFEYEGNLNKSRILKTTNLWIKEIPQVRSKLEVGLFRTYRHIYDKAWFNAEDLVEFHRLKSQERIDIFCNRKFDLFTESPIRFAIFSEGESHTLVFSCHHSIFDGAGHSIAFNEWSRLYNKLPPSNLFKEINHFNYRKTIKLFGVINSLKLLAGNLRAKVSRNTITLANLVERPESKKRFVKAITLRNLSSSSMRKDFYEICVKALDQVLNEKGDHENPILCYLPGGLRTNLKLKNTLQNSVVCQNLFIKRDDIKTNKLVKKIEKKLRSNPLKENSKFIFGVLSLCQIAPESYLRKLFSHMDSYEFPVTCSALLINAPIPARSLNLPDDWNNLYISGRGTLLKSPGVGFVLTGEGHRETLTIEYLEEVIRKSDIDRLIKILEIETLLSLHTK